MKKLFVALLLLVAPVDAIAQTTWSINPTTGTVILDNVTITDPLVELGVTVDLKLDKQATGGAAQCLQVGTTGLVTATGSACGGTGSSPGGANTNVQYNSSGTFAGDTSFTFNSGSKLVTVFDLLIADQATGGANQGLQIDTSGNVTKTGGIPAIPSGALTNHAVLAGRGTTSFGPLSLLTNGQFLIGSTGADPVAASITTSSLIATSGAGTFALNTPTITSGQLVKGGGSGAYSGLNITGLVLAQGAGAAIVYPGSTPCGAGTFGTGMDSSGVWSCGTPSGSGNVNAGGTLAANQIVLGQGSTNVATLGTLGTTTTVLHGNAAGAPTFGAVNLTTDVTGILGEPNGGTGLASGTTGGVLYYTSSTVLASSGQLLNHALVVGGGAVQAPHTITALTNGQLAIGSTGADPVPATITAGTGIAITNGAGSITIASTGGIGTGATGNDAYFSSAIAVSGETAILHATAFGFSTGASGATNQTALQTAVNTLPASGGVIICPAGTYAITGTVTIQKRVIINGGCTLNQQNASTTIFTVQTTASVEIDGLLLNNSSGGIAATFDGALGAAAWNSGTSYNPGDMVVSGGIPYTAAFANTNKIPPSSTACGSSQACWFVNSNTGSIMRGVVISGGAYSVKTIRAQQFYFGSNNFWSGATTSCLLVTNLGNQDGGDSTFTGSWCLPAAGANGITWEGSGGLRIENSKIISATPGSPAAACIVIQPAASTSTQAVQVVGNNISACNYGVLTQVVGGGTLFRLMIANNVIDGELNTVNLSNASVSEVSITGNILFTGVAQSLITIQDGTLITVDGNQFRGFNVSNTFGVTIGASASEVTIGSNNFSELTVPVIDNASGTFYTGGTVIGSGALPAAKAGSQVTCNDCKGPQDAGFTAGVCVSGGTNNIAKRSSGGAWICS